eukprot:TRINITY_DN16871_c0_g1_i1.p1 TRINITY_DN16871_c0_g1~~TRINITY_DN16871_c0_g1_i1.p1  ORF type:complete len:414 (+),score=60.95 TRINITY_DN16871_c0_g1_i1:72-1244(+)
MITSRLCRMGMRVAANGNASRIGLAQRGMGLQKRFNSNSIDAKKTMAEEVRKMQAALEDEELLAEPTQSFFEIVDNAWDTILDNISPFRLIDSFYYYLHDKCGIEWYLAVILMSGGLRLLSLPLQLHAARNTIRMQVHTTELQAIKRSQQVALSGKGLTEKDKALIKNNHKIQLEALYKKGGFKEWKSFLAIVSAVPFGLVFYTTRNLILTEKSVTTGGALWFSNLAEADPYYVLPIVSGFFMILSSEMSAAQTVPTKSKYFAFQQWGMRVFISGMAYFLSGSASGILLGMVMAAVTQCIQPALLRNKQFRTWFKVPSLERPPSTNLNVELTGMAKYAGMYQRWMEGAAFKTQKVGGGVGEIAYNQATTVKTLKDFKKDTKTRIYDASKI